jgi:GTP cyclohydrolase I
MSQLKPQPSTAAVDALRTLLRELGQDPDREGLRDTPRRVYQALAEMTAGEHESAAEHLAVTFDGGAYDEVVVLAGIPFTSLCEHHLLPFNGTASVAYLPGKVPVAQDSEASCTGKYRVVGLSKLARVVDVYARRLQLQEQMTVQIADALEEHLKPRGVAVLVEAAHSCMSCRGVLKTGAVMRTNALRGTFRSNDSLRAEVMALLARP